MQPREREEDKSRVLQQLMSFNACIEPQELDPAKRSFSAMVADWLLQDDDTGLALKGLDTNVGSGKKQEFDFQGEVARMLDAAKEGREEQGGSGIKIGDIGFDAGFLTADSLVDPIERLLRQAQQHILEEEYDPALGVLAKLLSEAPSHHEAIYLKAYCQANRDDGEDAATLALNTLRPLTDAALTSTLAVRVETLSDALRERRLVPLLVQFLFYKKDPGLLIPFLRQEVDIDPSSSLPHYLLAGALMVKGQLDEAIAVVDNGLRRVREDERERLVQIRAAASERLAERVLQPALDYYRHGKFVQALGALGKVSDLHRQTRLCIMFEAYLGELSGGATGFWSGLFSKPRQPVDVRPSGSPVELDTLGFFVVRKDLAYTKSRLEDLSWKGAIEAEKCALSAVALAPWFPFIHFISGQCIYARLGESLKADAPPSLDEFEEALHTARTHLEFAANDPEITNAPAALQAIDEMLAQAGKARKSQEARAKEFKER
jgi:tetratricopeptide (TPR) repeat protein